jgi:hypothetical protein
MARPFSEKPLRPPAPPAHVPVGESQGQLLFLLFRLSDDPLRRGQCPAGHVVLPHAARVEKNLGKISQLPTNGRKASPLRSQAMCFAGNSIRRTCAAGEEKTDSQQQ